MIDSDQQFATKLKTSFQELDNEFEIAQPGDPGVIKFKDYGPDLVLMNYGNSLDTAEMMFNEILTFDSTACIVSLLNDDFEDQVHEMYLKGARSSIKIANEPKTDKDVKMVMDQMFKICDDLKFENCVGCWKNSRYTSTIKLD
ncbi:MAG: hypothetical protein ACXAC2_04080 [Candidatus Kariarchaeaceae archaeon]